MGPNSVIENMEIGEHVVFNASQGFDSIIGNNVKIGPFSHVRPHCSIGDNCKIGSFVEVKNTSMGEGSKAPHLSYIGDAQIGSHVNFACGSITVNYDGQKKHKAIIEDNAFIGCNVNLISPVTVGRDAYIAAGSTITDTVPARVLAIARARQVNKDGWKLKKED